MRDIQELIKNVKKYKKTVLQQTLESKKNTVAYVTIKDKPRILKWFVPGFKHLMKNEYSILRKGTSNLNIPNVYEMDEDNNVLILNYISGENLCDIINNKKTSFNEKKRLMALLAEWFFNFHNHYKTQDTFQIRGDSNLRNFIFTDRIWGVDLEESRNGSPVEDIAQMCSSILSTDPMFTLEKFKLCKIFINSYMELAPGRILNINKEIAYSLLERIQWRPDDEELIRQQSTKIREQGLS